LDTEILSRRCHGLPKRDTVLFHDVAMAVEGQRRSRVWLDTIDNGDFVVLSNKNYSGNKSTE